MSLIGAIFAIVIFVIAYIVFKWLVGEAAAEWAPSMPGSVRTALALLFAIIFSGIGYAQGPVLVTRWRA